MEYQDIKSITELHAFFHYEKPLHPLISIVDLARVDRSHRKADAAYRIDLYSIACKQIEGVFGYGRTTYDFSEGTLMFTAPNQVLTPGIENKVKGWAIYIHPDFLHASLKGMSLLRTHFFVMIRMRACILLKLKRKCWKIALGTSGKKSQITWITILIT